MPSRTTADPAAGHRDQRPVQPRPHLLQRRAAPRPATPPGGAGTAASRLSPTQVTPATSIPALVDGRAELHRQRRRRPRCSRARRRAAAAPTASPAQSTGDQRSMPRRAPPSARLIAVSPGPVAARRPRRCRSAPPRRRSTARPACRRRRWCWPRPGRAPRRPGPRAPRSPGRPAAAGAGVGVAAAGPGAVRVNATDPVTGCPSSETTRYPISYRPAGPSGATPMDTVPPFARDLAGLVGPAVRADHRERGEAGLHGLVEGQRHPLRAGAEAGPVGRVAALQPGVRERRGRPEQQGEPRRAG